ncbi:MAG: hypothetical protein K2G70_02410 [Turicibacter sp.]|nr:hypothetical protein [Turicibacter sp.]
MRTELLNIALGYELPVANHPLFEKRWDKYAEVKNSFIEKLGLEKEQINELNLLLECFGAIERLSYLFVYKMGVTSTKLERGYVEALEEFLGSDEETQKK